MVAALLLWCSIVPAALEQPAWQTLDKLDGAIAAVEQRLQQAQRLLQQSKRQLARHEIGLARLQLQQQKAQQRWYQSLLRLWRYPTLLQLQRNWDVWLIGFRLWKLAALEDRQWLKQLQSTEQHIQQTGQALAQVQQTRTLAQIQAQSELAALLEQRQQRQQWLQQTRISAQDHHAAQAMALQQMRQLVPKRPATRASQDGQPYQAVSFRTGFAWPTYGLIKPAQSLPEQQQVGCTIQASFGSPVHAIAAGQVIYAAWLPGLGQVVMLEHGRQVQSVYGHLQQLDVHLGQTVAANAILGQVGATGSLLGPQLYFAIWQRGEPLSFTRLQQLATAAP